MKGRAAVVRIIAVLIALLFAYTVWPTPWRYEHACDRLVRINRFTQRADILLDGGWRDLVPNPFDDAARNAESERRGQWISSLTVCPSTSTR